MAAEQEEEAVQSYLDYVLWSLEKHNRYPEYAELKGLSGRAVLRFTVRSNGRIVDCKVGHPISRLAKGNPGLLTATPIAGRSGGCGYALRVQRFR